MNVAFIYIYLFDILPADKKKMRHAQGISLFVFYFCPRATIPVLGRQGAAASKLYIHRSPVTTNQCDLRNLNRNSINLR